MNFRNALSLFSLVFCGILFSAQSPKSFSTNVEQRVDLILSQMTLEEKIDYIGGTRDFYIRALPRLKPIRSTSRIVSMEPAMPPSGA